MVNSSRGRPSPPRPTRQLLIDAAHELFIENGYADTSVRAIARRAGVDHAMVNYYFGSKEGLLAETLSLLATPRVVLESIVAATADDPPHRKAQRYAASIVSVWEEESFREPILGILREAVVDEPTRRMVAEFFETEVFALLRQVVPARGRDARVAAGAAAISGMVFARYVLRLGPVVALSRDELVQALASLIEPQMKP